MKTAPPSGALRALKSPPQACTIPCDTQRPSPVPPVRLKKGSKVVAAANVQVQVRPGLGQ